MCDARPTVRIPVAYALCSTRTARFSKRQKRCLPSNLAAQPPNNYHRYALSAGACMDGIGLPRRDWRREKACDSVVRVAWDEAWQEGRTKRA